jgi:hypothetical protein
MPQVTWHWSSSFLHYFRLIPEHAFRAARPSLGWQWSTTVRIRDDYHHLVQVSIPWAEVGVAPVEDTSVLGSISP